MKNKPLIISLLIITQLSSCINKKENLTLSSFSWFGASVNGNYYPKAMLMLPIQLNNSSSNKKYFIQMDTGTPKSMIFKHNLNEITIDSNNIDSSSIKIDFSIANKPSQINFRIIDYGEDEKSKYGEDTVILGLLGLDFFETKLLFIDYANERFDFFNQKDSVPTSLSKQMSEIPCEIKNNRIFIETYLSDDTLNLLFDVGASILPIITTKPLWQKLTKKEGNEEDNKQLEVPGVGGFYNLVGSKTKNTTKIGKELFEEITVYYEKNESIPFHLINCDGLIGNQLFYNEHSVLINFIDKEILIGKSQ